MKKHIYVISNPAYPGVFKVGQASDLKKRLSSYQTSDPNRAYKVEFSVETTHYDEVERQVHKSFNRKREWVEGSLVDIIETIKEKVYEVDKEAERAYHKQLHVDLALQALPSVKRLQHRWFAGHCFDEGHSIPMTLDLIKRREEESARLREEAFQRDKKGCLTAIVVIIGLVFISYIIGA